jgi:hypothetical protein
VVLSSYSTRHIKRFDDYIIDVHQRPEPLDGTFPAWLTMCTAWPQARLYPAFRRTLASHYRRHCWIARFLRGYIQVMHGMNASRLRHLS